MAAQGARVAAVVAVLGLLFATGCVIAALFELQGFGDRDGDPSVLSLRSLAVAACVGVPVLAWRALLPRSAPVKALAALPVGAVVVLFLGIGLRRRVAPAARRPPARLGSRRMVAAWERPRPGTASS